jgi:hypothetical protein
MAKSHTSKLARNFLRKASVQEPRVMSAPVCHEPKVKTCSGPKVQSLPEVTGKEESFPCDRFLTGKNVEPEKHWHY